MSKYSIGIDLHKSIIQVCVMDPAGEIAEERRFRVSNAEDGVRVIEYLSAWKSAGRYVVEAVGCDRWFVNEAKARGFDIVVADPAKLGLRMSGKKTDRRDALELARRLRLGDIDRSAFTYYPTEHEFGSRKLLRTRHRLIQVRQTLVCQIRGILDAYLVRPTPASLWTKKGIAWLRSLQVGTDDLSAALQALTESLAGIQGQIAGLDAQIRRKAKDPDVAVLSNVLPSVSTLTAATIVAELGDVSRFKNTRAVTAYAGLAPRVMNSAETTFHGRITKQGNPELRWILSEWAVRLLHFNSEVRGWAAPQYRKRHKNKVRIALARRLLIAVHVMLSRGEVFSMEKCLALRT